MRLWLPVSETATATCCEVVSMRVCVSLPGLGLLLFGAVSPSLWVKAACLFIRQAVKSASYQPAPANAAVINSTCLLSLTEDYPEAYGWFTEVADTLPIFLPPALCVSAQTVFVTCSLWVSVTDIMSSSPQQWLRMLTTLDRDSPLICDTRLMVQSSSYLFGYLNKKDLRVPRKGDGVIGSNVNIYKYLTLPKGNLSCVFKCIFW